MIIIFYIQIFSTRINFTLYFRRRFLVDFDRQHRMQIISSQDIFQRIVQICYLIGSQWYLSDRFANRCCLSSETHIPSLSFSTNILAFIRCLLAFCMDELANRSERGMYIHTYDNRTTKVNALMMSADMCMNNVISVCAWYESIRSWLVLLLGYITYWSTFKCLY